MRGRQRSRCHSPWRTRRNFADVQRGCPKRKTPCQANGRASTVDGCGGPQPPRPTLVGSPNLTLATQYCAVRLGEQICSLGPPKRTRHSFSAAVEAHSSGHDECPTAASPNAETEPERKTHLPQRYFAKLLPAPKANATACQSGSVPGPPDPQVFCQPDFETAGERGTQQL